MQSAASESESPSENPLRHHYTVGWISRLRIEYDAAFYCFDQTFSTPKDFPNNDDHQYEYGRVGKHYIVIGTLLEDTAKSFSTATIAQCMAMTFPNIRLSLLVGIGGGAPRLAAEKSYDIRLGDVVVGMPGEGHNGIVQHDYGKYLGPGEPLVVSTQNSIIPPPQSVRKAVERLDLVVDRSEKGWKQLSDDVEAAIESVPERHRKKFLAPDPKHDLLFVSKFVHLVTSDQDRLNLRNASTTTNQSPPHNSTSFPSSDQDCLNFCLVAGSSDIPPPQRLVSRLPHDPNRGSVVHRGLIASGNQLIRSTDIRDRFPQVICFEMEAAGLAPRYPCLVIRGISDYCDTHKNEKWQGYAAMVAAVYAKKVLEILQPASIGKELPICMTYEQGVSIQNDLTKLIDSNTEAKIKAWLSPSDHSSSYNFALGKRICGNGPNPSSGAWFLNSHIFQSWRTGNEDSEQVLCLYGFGGCGKTVLCATVIDYLERELPPGQKPIWFFFSFREPEKKGRLEHMLSSLIWQLFCQHRGKAGKVLSSFLKLDGSGGVEGMGTREPRKPSSAELCWLLKSILKEIGMVWIVIDGIDECGTLQGQSPNENLLLWVRDMVTTVGSGIRLLIATQQHEHIKSRLDKCIPEHCRIMIEAGHLGVCKDIKDYVSIRVGESEQLQERWVSKPNVLGYIKQEIVRKSDGMFLMAAALVDDIEQFCLDESSVRHALETQIKGNVRDLYRRMLHRIPETFLPRTTRLLQFMMYSPKPILLTEAIDMLIVYPDENPRVRTQERILNIKEITRYLGAFVRIGVVFNEEDDMFSVLELAHLTVRQFLTSPGEGSETSRMLRRSLQRVEANLSNAKVCLEYLASTFGCLVATLLDGDPELITRVVADANCLPLADYALEYWHIFAREVERSTAEEDVRRVSLNESIDRLLDGRDWAIHSLGGATVLVDFLLTHFRSKMIERGEFRKEIEMSDPAWFRSGVVNTVTMLFLFALPSPYYACVFWLERSVECCTRRLGQRKHAPRLQNSFGGTIDFDGNAQSWLLQYFPELNRTSIYETHILPLLTAYYGPTNQTSDPPNQSNPSTKKSKSLLNLLPWRLSKSIPSDPTPDLAIRSWYRNSGFTMLEGQRLARIDRVGYDPALEHKFQEEDMLVFDYDGFYQDEERAFNFYDLTTYTRRLSDYIIGGWLCQRNTGQSVAALEREVLFDMKESKAFF